MVGRIGPVDAVSATATIDAAKVYRNDHIPTVETNGLAVQAARTDLLELTGTRVAAGAWLNEATARYPAVVLGAEAAERLGIGLVGPDTQVRIGGQWFTVVGILERSELASELDSAALVGWPVARQRLGFDGRATSVYVRAAPEQLADVRAVLGATANPEAPNEVEVSRPSDALAAQQAADQAFTSLLLGVGAVALLVGGVGVANTMVISVMERRTEIGLRRSLGATRGQVRTQFLTESVLLSFLGGLGGALVGAGVTTAYAVLQGWTAVIPTWAIAAALGLTVLIGGGAGLLPAVRASRLPPTEALATR
jgi:putative ABC transport system permease protein